MYTTAASVDTRVRVDRLENIKAIVFPANAPCSEDGMFPDLIASFALDAWRTSVESSLGVRSAMDRKCRGANGEVGRFAAGPAVDNDRVDINGRAAADFEAARRVALQNDISCWSSAGGGVGDGWLGCAIRGVQDMCLTRLILVLSVIHKSLE